VRYQRLTADFAKAKYALRVGDRRQGPRRDEFFKGKGEILQGLKLSLRAPLRAKGSECVRPLLRFRCETVVKNFDTHVRLVARKAACRTLGQLTEAIGIDLVNVVPQSPSERGVDAHAPPRRELCNYMIK
jgi:hypothetical protein